MRFYNKCICRPKRNAEPIVNVETIRNFNPNKADMNMKQICNVYPICNIDPNVTY